MQVSGCCPQFIPVTRSTLPGAVGQRAEVGAVPAICVASPASSVGFTARRLLPLAKFRLEKFVM